MILVSPGSFDPVTLGHTGILKRASFLCDKLIVAVAVNCEKKPVFTLKERVLMLKETFKDTDNIEVVSFDGLFHEFAWQNKADAVVKGLRSSVDMEYEKQIASLYMSISPPIETIFLISEPSTAHISSTMAKQISYYGGNLDGLVPNCIIEMINNKMRKMRV